MQTEPEFTVILPFGHDEEHIGAVVRGLHEALTETGRPFEILAVGENSNDNSHAVLSLLAREMQELRSFIAPLGGAHDTGMKEARGRVLCFLVSPEDVLEQSYSIMIDGLLEGASDSSYVEVGTFYTICCPNYAVALRRDVQIQNIPIVGRLAHIALTRLRME